MSDAWEALWRQPEPERQPSTNVIAIDGDGARRYALRALESECAAVATTPEGERNDALNRAAFRIGRHVRPGCLDYDEARQALADAGRACGLPQHEIDTVLRDHDDAGLRQGQAHPRHAPERDPIPDVTVLDLEPAEADAFWSARPLLAHLHAYARARRVSPWAVLGVALARVATAVPCHVVLPPITGGIASLNLFVGLVGRSGSGKGAAEAVAAEALDVGQIESHKIGSGEGIAHGYMKRERGEVIQHTHAVLFSVPEVDTFVALGDRKGATLLPELRSAWSGEHLGFGYADPNKRLPVPAHQYRMCLVAGIQPGRAGALLDDTDGGTPQRFLWMPAVDTDAPDMPPPCPEPLRHRAPDTRPMFAGPGGRIVLAVCERARATIDGARLARLRGDGEALDGHGLLTRLKVAAALGLAEGRLEVDDTDWELAGVVQRKSDACRAGLAAQLSAAVKQRNEARAQYEAERAVVVAETVEDKAIKQVCGAIVRKLRRVEDGLNGGDLRRVIRADKRQYFEDAIERLTEAGQVVAEDASHGVEYRLAEGVI